MRYRIITPTWVSSVIVVLAAVRIIRCQVCPADGTFQHIEARDTCAVRDAPPAVHPADRRMLAVLQAATVSLQVVISLCKRKETAALKLSFKTAD